MKRALVCAVLLAAPIRVTAAENPRAARAALVVIEKDFNGRIERYNIDDPFLLLGATRGVYLEGYGAVFTAEVNLVAGPVISPFRPTISKEEIAKLRQKKLSRLPVLKQIMRDLLVNSAATLETVSPNEQIVVGVSLFYFSWEDSTGLPSQILMQADRKALLPTQAGRLDRAALDSVIRTQEF